MKIIITLKVGGVVRRNTEFYTINGKLHTSPTLIQDLG